MKRLISGIFTIMMAVSLVSVQAQNYTDKEIAVGEEIEASLDTGDTDVYSVNLDKEQYVFGTVHQKEVNVVVTIYNPEGKVAATFDGPARGNETFQFNTKVAGTYKIEVKPFEEETGLYTIMLKTVEPVATDPAGKVNQLMTQYEDNVPGASIMVMLNNEEIFQESYGLANLAYNEPMTSKTVHNIGSTSKHFLTFGLQLLAVEGKLSLDDDVREYIPELPEFEHSVTLHDLATHTSGYREFLNLIVMTGRNPSTTLNQDKIIEIVQRQPKLQNVPGAEFNYNNTGYALLTEVIERITDTPFPEWMQENVFTPIGMNNTVVRSSQNQVVKNRSQGYQNMEDGEFEEVTDLGGAMGAGGIHTTMGDLKKWINNLLEPKVGTKEMIHEMITSDTLNNGNPTNYGLGFMLGSYKGLEIFEHGGADLAHRSMLRVVPDINGAIVTQSNNASFDGNIANQVMEIFFEDYFDAENEEAEEKIAEESTEEFEYSPAKFDDLTGRYELEIRPGFILTFSRDEDRIYTQATGQPEINLTATSDSTFTLVGVPAAITFHLNEDGSADSLTLHQNGNHIAKKIEFELSPEEMKEYAGQYFSDEIETLYTIVLEEETLFMQNYQLEDDIELSANTKDTFGGSMPITDIKFIRNESGQITGFNASNGRTRGVFFRKWDK